MRLMILLLSLMGLFGCAQMNVTVSILDRKFWSSPEHLSSSISDQVARTITDRGTGGLASRAERVKSTARNELLRLPLDPNDVERLANPMNRFIDSGFKEAEGHFKKAFTQLGNATADPPKGNRLQILFDAQSELDAGYALIERTVQQVSADLRKEIGEKLDPKASDRSKTVQQQIAQAESNIQKAAYGRYIGDRGILEDLMASDVVFAPESYWKRAESPSGINNTNAFGLFGNTDIAIKMESVGDFTIKGVRLDASKITQATFAVGRQAIKTAAAVYGIPLPLPTPEAKKPALASATGFAEIPIGFESPDRRRAAAEDAILRRRLARLTVLETILMQRVTLKDPKATDAARATAIGMVKKVFSANRAEFDSPPASNK